MSINTLFSAQTTNANGTAIPWSGKKRATVYCWGTFDGCTVTFEMGCGAVGGTQWFTPTDNSFTAQGAKTIEAEADYIRGVVASAGASTSINMEIR